MNGFTVRRYKQWIMTRFRKVLKCKGLRGSISVLKFQCLRLPELLKFWGCWGDSGPILGEGFWVIKGQYGADFRSPSEFKTVPIFRVLGLRV